MPHPLPLPQLVRGLERGRLPSASVALTFDDGYADNLTRAKPLLERYGVPATMFVTTAHLGSEFWWDRLYWRFTAASCARLFGEHFGATDVTVTSHGNVLACIAFLSGLAYDELSRRELDAHDEDFPLVVSVRAVKRPRE